MASFPISLILTGTLILMAWLLPNHYPPWGSSHSELLAAVAAGVLGMAGLGKPTAPRIGVPGPAIFLAAIAAIPLVQAATGHIVMAGDGWIAALYLLCSAWTVLWSARVAQQFSDRWVTCLASVLLAGALLSSLAAMLQGWEIDVGAFGLYVTSVRPGYPPHANLGQPNQLASLLGLGLASLVVLYEQRRVSGVWAALAALPITLTLAMTQSRSALLLFAAALLWQLAMAKRVSLRTPRVALGVLAAVWAASFLAWPRIAEAAGIKVLSLTTDRMQAGPRTVIWSQLWDAVWLRPWTGFGWNQVSMAQIAVVADHPRSRLAEHSHNLILDLALWNGVPLASLIILIAILWLIGAWRRIRTVNGAFGLLVILLLLAHSLVEFPLDYLYFLVPFGMALGIVVNDAGTPDSALMPRTVGVVGMVVFVCATCWAAWDYWRVEEAYRDMRFTVARIGRPMVTQAPPLLSTQFTQLAAFHHFALSTPRPNMSKEELTWMRDVTHRYAYAPSLYRLALAQALNGDLDGARLTLLQLRKLHGDKPYEEARSEIRELAKAEYPVLQQLQIP